MVAVWPVGAFTRAAGLFAGEEARQGGSAADGSLGTLAHPGSRFACRRIVGDGLAAWNQFPGLVLAYISTATSISKQCKALRNDQLAVCRNIRNSYGAFAQ